MIESFVDLSYRGLSLGRRVKLTTVRPSNGYLEMPAPMPVGTRIALTTDEGVIVDAVVAEIREQTSGSDRAPGMKIIPVLGVEVAASWWQARVTLTEEEVAPRVVVPIAPPVAAAPVKGPTTAPLPAVAPVKGPTTAPLPVVAAPVEAAPVVVPPVEAVILRPRPSTIPEPIDDVPNGLVPSDEDDEPEIRISDPVNQSVPVAIDARTEAINSKRTVVMAAVDQDLLKQLTQQPGEIEKLVERTGDHPVIDDGKRTMVMEAIDPALLGMEASASGTMPAADDESKPSGKKRRPKRR